MLRAYALIAALLRLLTSFGCCRFCCGCAAVVAPAAVVATDVVNGDGVAVADDAALLLPDQDEHVCRQMSDFVCGLDAIITKLLPWTGAEITLQARG